MRLLNQGRGNAKVLVGWGGGGLPTHKAMATNDQVLQVGLGSLQFCHNTCGTQARN